MTETLEITVEEEGIEGGEVEHRAAKVDAVSFPERTIDVIVIPYETPTIIDDGRRAFEEIVSRGAFGNVQQRAGGRIKVFRDHEGRLPVGYVKTLYPNRDEGLLAKLQISRTDDGEETLVLADDGVLDASAGFGLLRDKDGRVKHGAAVWETRSRRRLNHLWLDHVAMVGNPAYPTANVLDVRASVSPAAAMEAAGPVPTPNRDTLAAQRLQTLYADLDRRYGLNR